MGRREHRILSTFFLSFSSSRKREIHTLEAFNAKE